MPAVTKEKKTKSADKTQKVKATPKVAPKTTKSEKKATKSPKTATKKATSVDPQKAKELEKAKAAGLTLVKYRLLASMKKDKPMTYSDFHQKTGYYSGLTKELHKDKEGSLASTGHVKQAMVPDTKAQYSFTITEKGLKALAKS